MTRPRAACWLCLLSLAAAPAAAQTVRVSVADAATGAPVAGAMVRVEGAAGELVRAGFSDAQGGVALQIPQPGRYAVRATRTGYAPAMEMADVGAAGEAAVGLRMQARPLELDTVTVVGAERGRREVGRQTFERRRLAGGGIYLDSAYVAQIPARWPGELLRSVPDIELQLVTGRQGYRRPYTRLGRRCLVNLVNGLPYYGGWPRWVELEETLRRTDVVAVEVYREDHEVPPEYRRYSGRCGLVIYWTEDGWHNPYRGVVDRP
ncbi:MAG TPA: carboxypeptidase-like regulatory domain-containing protein [Longimicrobium sp.]|nr:carboxypeptidase-like regulatory domain-containing protein [Longimicrobium sp.]